ncbi:ArsC family reductase [Agitococcus lubricus]|uniref:Spx/MgsR family transcriptional regulator n=1 Tax=Agitococcus lubricus TaxID=1077255 RepID=A0A2T5J043_9GAMM|nr:ArsC family reductase [Agitococcus lubricus]PTQ89720.1 Spx/MgsR family transcriptional regulator [Agitococcus lubricus]
MLTIYGIKNCDTMKKAFTWLDGQGIAYQFHDYKKAALDEKTLDDWLNRVGWQAIVNQKGTTWRKLALDKNTLDNQSIKSIILQNLSMIKRPLLVLDNNNIVLGFDVEQWQHFAPSTMLSAGQAQ